MEVFKTAQGKARFLEAYAAMLARWPVDYEELDVATRFGNTHIIACGPSGAPALFLLHCYFGTATVWLPNVAGLSLHFRTYAVDVIGEPNKSQPVRPITSTAEFAQW